MNAAKKPPGKISLLRERLAVVTRVVREGHAQLRVMFRHWRNRLPAPVKRALRRTTRWTLHSLNGVLMAVVLLFIAAHLWLPTLADRKEQIEGVISTELGAPVRIEQIETFWDGLNPGIRLHGLRMQDAAGGETAIGLRELRLSLSWRPLLTGRIAINSLVVVEPSLIAERLANGQFRITGLNLPATGGTEMDLGEWLLGQREMVIENGRLQWVDAVPDTATPERLSVDHVFITLRNDGNHHYFDARAAFPKSLCGKCRVTAEILGNPLRNENWTGEISLQARDLSLSALPNILRGLLPEQLDGHLTVQLESRWRNNRPEAIRGRVAGRRLVLPLPGLAQPLAVRGIDTFLDWEGDLKSGRIEFARLALGLARSPWQVGRSRIEYSPTRQKLEFETIDIDDVARLLQQHGQEGPLAPWLAAARPGGTLKRMRLELEGPLTDPQDFLLVSDVRALRFAPSGRVPGFSSISGRLRATRRDGEFRLESGPNRLELPLLLAAPVELLQMKSHISWRQEPDHWIARAADIRLLSRDGRVSGDVELRVPQDSGQSPILKADLKGADGVVSHAARYYPKAMPAPLRDYLETAVVDGRMTEGSVRFHGALQNFPFRDGKGSFEARAHVSQGVLRYLPDWEPVRDMEVDLFFTGTGMQITASHGRLRELEVGRVSIAIDDFRAPQGAVVQVNTRAFGTMSDVLAVLEDSKAPQFAPFLINGMQATGSGILSLDLQIPARNPRAVRIDGDYKFLGGSLNLPFRTLQADGLRGRIEFSETGLRSGNVRARMFGNPVALEARPSEGAGALVDVRGVVSQASIHEMLGGAIAARVSGEAPWSGQAVLKGSRLEWRVDSDWSRLELRFPAPFAKARGVPLAFRMQGLPAPAADQQRVGIEAVGRVTGKLGFRKTEGRWEFDRGRIGAGERVAELPDEPGLHLSARLASLDVDSWWQYLRPQIKVASGTNGWFQDVKRLSIEVDSFEALDRLYGHQSLDIAVSPEKWTGTLQGEVANGRAVFLPAGCRTPGNCPEAFAWSKMPAGTTPALYLDLEQLIVPPARQVSTSSPTDPRGMPLLGLRSAALVMDGRKLGALELVAEPVQNGWEFESLRLRSADTQLTARGLWDIDWQAHQNTRFDIAVTSSNFGKTLDQLDFPDLLVGGRLTITSNWRWPGAPSDWSLSAVKGEAMVAIKGGRFPNISPGAGRLLGVLDVRSLTRYLMFDLSSVFGKGMTFEGIKGKVRIADGNAYTDKFSIDAPGADIDLIGRIGLVDRDLDLEMRVAPRLVEEFVLGGTLLGGPVLGAVAGVVGKLAEQPTKDTQLKYTVTGAWKDPVIENIGRPRPAVEPSE